MAARLYFYGNAMGDDVRAERAIASDSPAATRKVVGLARALRAAGARPTIVSMGRGKTRPGIASRPGKVRRLHGIPIVYGPMSHVPILSQVLTLSWLLAIAARLGRRRPKAVHLFYNQLNAYLPAVIWLRLADRRVAVDIEDGPVAGGASHATAFGNASTSLFGRLVNGGALIACTALAGGTAIRPTLPYYGSVDCDATAPSARGVRARTLDVLFSGYLNDDTGVSTFVRAVERLRGTDDAALDRLRIHVTGMGPGLGEIERIAGGLRPRVEMHGRLDDEAYRQLLQRCAIGLSLKRADGLFGDTTFPSKTVEYGEYGLAIIATDISDVRRLFGDTIFYVTGDSDEELAWLLRRAATDRKAVAEKAAASADLVRARLSKAAAGRELTSFLFGGAR